MHVCISAAAPRILFLTGTNAYHGVVHEIS